MAPARSATAAMLLGAAAGCGVGAEQPAALTRMMPAVAYNDVARPVTIYGQGGFRPTYRFDTGSGDATVDVGGFSATLTPSAPAGAAARYELGAVVWESVGLLGAELPPAIPAGAYDLLVRDPRGNTARLPRAFTSLGPDTTAPRVTIASPENGGLVGAGAPVAVIVDAEDGFGQILALEVTIATSAGPLPPYRCAVSGRPFVTCPFTVTAPAAAAAPDALTITATAAGAGGPAGQAQVALTLVPAPIPTGLTPDKGSTLGGTLVTVSGDYFVRGATTVAFDGQQAAISGASSTTITVLTPPHPAGSAAVTVTTGGATATLAGSFIYQAPPTVREIDPTSGPAAGYLPIAVVGTGFTPDTQVTFNGVPLLCPRFVNGTRIEGLVPPGTGTAAVVAADPVGGTLPTANVPFQYLDGPASDGGAAAAAALPDGGCPGGAAP